VGEGVAPHHAVLQGLPDGQVAIRLADADAMVLVNGVRLGPQPTPLLHGDKVTIGGNEYMLVDERRSGSTQYVQAMDPASLAAAAKKASQRKATTGTGGRLVSLTDGREYAVTGPSLVIGRDASCDVVITSKNVSRRHAEVMASPKGYVLIDSSTNGTFVNGQRVEGQYLLARGDVIACGDNEFRFYADLAPAEPAPPPQPETPQVQAPAPPPAPPPQAPPAQPSAPEVVIPDMPAPAGAEHRLSNTLHGVPGVRPGVPPTPAAPVPPKAPEPPAAAPPPAAPTPPPAAPAEVPPAPPPAAAPEPAATRPSGGSGALANLVVRSGPLKGHRFPIRVPIVNVGRADYNDIVLPDDSVSTVHAKLQRREGIWMLVDLESTNGTLVDGEPVQGEVPLSPGSFIRFGDVQTIFEPTDDSIDAPKGSSTRMISAIKLPDPKPPTS
jgi:pSer/pThr/pTyr-binding forkhead associated (FHA) protein